MWFYFNDKLFFLGEDSDSECHTSSTEDSPQAGPPSGGTRPPLKRERPRKKPPAPAAPQVPLGPPMGAPQGPPRTVAIPVAMPIAPAVIPRLPPPTQVRIPAESEQGEIIINYHTGCPIKIDGLLKMIFYT